MIFGANYVIPYKVQILLPQGNVTLAQFDSCNKLF